MRAERDKFILESNFAREKLERCVKDMDHQVALSGTQLSSNFFFFFEVIVEFFYGPYSYWHYSLKREEMNGILTRNVEFQRLIVDYQKQLRESSQTMLAAEEHSRKLTVEVRDVLLIMILDVDFVVLNCGLCLSIDFCLEARERVTP